MTTFSGRSVRRATGLVGAALAVLALAGCSGDEGQAATQPTSTQPTLSSLGALPGLTMVDTSWPAFRTAKVTAVTGRPESRAVDVTYESTDADCEALAGFAQRRSDERVEVTVVIGHEEECEPGAPVTATTVVPLDEPLGTAEPVASRYSAAPLEIG